MLSFNDWLSSGERGGFRFKLDVQISMDVAGQGGCGSLENWTTFMEVICVSSLISLLICFCLIDLRLVYKKFGKIVYLHI